MRMPALLAAVVAATISITAQAQAPAPATPDALVAAAKRAAGTDYQGTFVRICVAPENLAAAAGRGEDGGAAPPARVVPDRATWYARPYKVFDNLYFIGTKIHSAWALRTSDGIIVIDTLFDYAIEAEMVEGLTALGLDPRTIKYMLISHAHGDHDQGAALLQSRYGAKVVMGEADWDSTLQRRCHRARRRAEARHRRRPRRPEAQARRHHRGHHCDARTHPRHAVLFLSRARTAAAR